MGVQLILPVKVSVTIGTMLNFDGDIMYNQTLKGN